MAEVVAKSEIERRIEMYPVPNFLAWFLRQQWILTLQDVYLTQGEESETWEQSIAMLEDLVWSVQPKRTKDDRKHLVALLPALLKRCRRPSTASNGRRKGRERFMANLVEGARGIGEALDGSATLATASVAEQALADAEQAKAAGDEEKAAKAEALAAAMTQAEPVSVANPKSSTISSSRSRRISSAARGSSSKRTTASSRSRSSRGSARCAARTCSPNRQGLKALSMNAEELAERFRTDRARPGRGRARSSTAPSAA
jgi:hypothetical protein